MFEYIRTHQKLMQILLLILIVPSFALVGLGSYSSFGDSPNKIAKVDGKVVTKEEWDQAVRQQLQRVAQAMGEHYDPKLVDTPEARRAVLDNLISERAVFAAVRRDHLVVSDDVVRSTLMGIPALQSATGQFDRNRYQQLLAMQGLSERQYEAELRQQLASQQVVSAIGTTAFEPKTVLERLNQINEQERTVETLSFKASDYRKDVTITEADIKAYYDAHADALEIPQQLSIQYMVLDGPSILNTITVPEQDVQAYYDKNQSKYRSVEQRKASHILFAVKDNASPADEAKIKAKAEAVLTEVRQHPEQFAELARKNSDDAATAASGGNLGSFGKGEMPDQFDAKVFSMQPDAISDLVRTKFGYHIIHLTGVLPEKIKPLEEVRASILTQLKNEQATEKFASLADSFRNAVYEQGDGLQSVSDKFHLPLQTADGLKRNVDPSTSPTAPYNNEKVLSAIFAPEVAGGKENTQAIEVAPQILLAAHVTKNTPAARPPLAEVSAKIRGVLEEQRAFELASKAADARMAAIEIQDDKTAYSAEQVVSRSQPGSFDQATLKALMQASVNKLPSFISRTVPGQAVVIYRISKVGTPAVIDPANRTATEQQINSVLSRQETASYTESLKSAANVKLYKSAEQTGKVDAEAQ